MSAWETSTPGDIVLGAYHAALTGCAPIAAGRIASIEGNRSYSYRYANLADVHEDVDKVLNANGLVKFQVPTSDGPRVTVETTLLHESGQWITFAPLSMSTGNSPQATGSAITYARRYSLLCIMGVATEDDDGKAAESAYQSSQARPVQNRSQNGPAAGRMQTRGQSGPQGGGQRPAPTAIQQQVQRTLAGLSSADSQAIQAEFREHFGCGMSALPAARHVEGLRFVNEAMARMTEPQPDDDGDSDGPDTPSTRYGAHDDGPAEEPF